MGNFIAPTKNSCKLLTTVRSVVAVVKRVGYYKYKEEKK